MQTGSEQENYVKYNTDVPINAIQIVKLYKIKSNYIGNPTENTDQSRHIPDRCFFKQDLILLRYDHTGYSINRKGRNM